MIGYGRLAALKAELVHRIQCEQSAAFGREQTGVNRCRRRQKTHGGLRQEFPASER